MWGFLGPRKDSGERDTPLIERMRTEGNDVIAQADTESVEVCTFRSVNATKSVNYAPPKINTAISDLSSDEVRVIDPPSVRRQRTSSFRSPAKTPPATITTPRTDNEIPAIPTDEIPTMEPEESEEPSAESMPDHARAFWDYIVRTVAPATTFAAKESTLTQRNATTKSEQVLKLSNQNMKGTEGKEYLSEAKSHGIGEADASQQQLKTRQESTLDKSAKLDPELGPASFEKPLTAMELEGEIPSKIPAMNWSWLRKLKNLPDPIITAVPQLSKAPGVHETTNGAWIFYVLVFLFMVSGLAYGSLSSEFDLSSFFKRIDWDRNLTVAFIGNAYFFVNDVPRVLESMAGGHVQQDSCLHSGGSLSGVLMRGNGMYNRWRTSEAVISKYYDDDTEGYYTVYDYGMCTVAQLLQGYDNDIKYQNAGGAYYNDGNNPCMNDETYLNYVENKLSNQPPKWDFVVLVDQTKRMAIQGARGDTIEILTNTYAPLLNASGAIPVIVDTHAFWSSQTNMTGLSDVPTFTASIYEGVHSYVSALASALPAAQQPLVAPIGLAYLTVWEENYDLWEQLFLDDEVHSSVSGTYLFSCVLYATLFGHLPDDTITPELLFANSRRLMGQAVVEETDYLRAVARRVTLQGYVPSSLKAVWDTMEQTANYEYENGGDDDDSDS